MKRRFGVSVIIISLLAVIAACGKSGYVPDEYASEPISNLYGSNRYMVNTPSKVFFSDGYLTYYSKADGKCYIFNHDPLANYSDENSPAAKFAEIWNNEYCNGRLYAVKGSEIYSIALDATDAKLIFTAGYAEEGRDLIYPPLHYHQYLYFLVLNSEEGYDLYRYDTVNEKTVNLTENKGFRVSSFFFGDGCIYFKKSYEGSLFKADLSLNGETVLEGVKSGVFDGTYTYGMEKEFEGDNERFIGIFKDDLKNLTHEVIYYEPSGLSTQIKYITDEYIYFTKNESVELGKRNGNGVYNSSGGRLYRIDKNGGGCVTILDNAGYDISQLYYFDGVFFTQATKYDASDVNNVKSSSFLAKLTLDDEGYITAVEKLEIIK